MTEAMWKRREITLKSRITRLSNKSKKASTLEIKFQLQRQAKQARQELHQHRLNYFELTGQDVQTPKGLVDTEKLVNAITTLKTYGHKNGTYLNWVNWRSGAQVKMTWNGISSFSVYFDMRTNDLYTSVHSARDALLEKAFKTFMPEGAKPRIEYGHGWTKARHEFWSNDFISANQIAELANELGLCFTVIYVQECIDARPAFDILGIPLVPGEMGKEWIDGEYHPYSCPTGKCL